MEDQSRLSANRIKTMQLFILKSLISEIKRGKRIDFSQIPSDIVALFQQEVARNEELRMAVEKHAK
ncbi:hypothetical protein [Flavobacterium sp. N1994]|uniref:hypothetical protein n=1 Tax=Flavobacterium sp. N1994 TaxID=2986827 RepID=UPI0022234FE1|nr:hypothetical protein [Flavobacterium sp. N1994]